MDWIERWFNLNPDGGDGSLETLIVAGFVVCAAALAASLSPSVRRWARKALAAIRMQPRS